MYTPRGFGSSELGDIEVVADGDTVHLFHLTLPNHDLVQHAVSTDGLRWDPLPTALRTGDPGACDDDQIWTMSVTRDADRWRMLYTALATSDEGAIQRTGSATSDDLVTWEKSRANPVAEADSRWYETDPAIWGSVSWRDPKPVRVDDCWYALVAAREKTGPLLRRGCVGLMVSADLTRWEVRQPLFAPRRFWDLECPQAFQIDNSWFLTAAIMEDRRQHYWTAPRFGEAWTEPSGGGLLAPAGHYAGRVCRWQGADLLWCWHQPGLVEGWMTTPRTIDWTLPRNPFGKWLAPPLELIRQVNGSLGRRSFAGWDAYRDRQAASIAPAAATLFGHVAVAADEGWRLPGSGAMDVLTAIESAGDLIIEGHLALAGRGGLAFRLDDIGGGYFVELCPGSATVSLQKWLPTDDVAGRRGYEWRVLQSGDLGAAFPNQQRVPFRLLVCGPYIEVSLDREVVLATFSGQRLVGRWGLWTAGSPARGFDIRASTLRQPWAR